MGKSSVSNIGAGNLGMHRISFESDHASARRHGASKPDGAVATKCTNLKDGRSANSLCKHR